MMLAGVKTDFVLVRGVLFFFGPSLAVSGHHCGIPAPQFPQTDCQSSKILLHGLFLSLIYLFFKTLYFFLVLSIPFWVQKGFRNTHPSPCPHITICPALHSYPSHPPPPPPPPSISACHGLVAGLS